MSKPATIKWSFRVKQVAGLRSANPGVVYRGFTRFNIVIGYHPLLIPPVDICYIITGEWDASIQDCSTRSEPSTAEDESKENDCRRKDGKSLVMLYVGREQSRFIIASTNKKTHIHTKTQRSQRGSLGDAEKA